jgi:hypothetical protein
MTNDSIFQKKNMLSYVNEAYDTPAPGSEPTPLSFEKTPGNKLAVVSIILTGLAFFTSILVIPTVISLAFSVAALMTALKRKTSKVLPLVSLIISAVLFVGSTLVVGFIFASYKTDPVVRVPANYASDAYSGMAYKLDPKTQVKCGSDGKCLLNISLMATTARCDAGGTITQDLFSTSTGERNPQTVSFPAIKAGDKASVKVIYNSSPNDVLMVTKAPTFVCK